jgi:hypothetical protein
MYDLLLYKRNTVSNTNAGTKESGGVSLEQTAEGKRLSLSFPSAREGDGSAWKRRLP